MVGSSKSRRCDEECGAFINAVLPGDSEDADDEDDEEIPY